jgi:hypothetical protein
MMDTPYTNALEKSVQGGVTGPVVVDAHMLRTVLHAHRWYVGAMARHERMARTVRDEWRKWRLSADDTPLVMLHAIDALITALGYSLDDEDEGDDEEEDGQ